jgi:hypothetical protein
MSSRLVPGEKTEESVLNETAALATSMAELVLGLNADAKPFLPSASQHDPQPPSYEEAIKMLRIQRQQHHHRQPHKVQKRVVNLTLNGLQITFSQPSIKTRTTNARR